MRQGFLLVTKLYYINTFPLLVLCHIGQQQHLHTVSYHNSMELNIAWYLGYQQQSAVFTISQRWKWVLHEVIFIQLILHSTRWYSWNGFCIMFPVGTFQEWPFDFKKQLSHNTIPASFLVYKYWCCFYFNFRTPFRSLYYTIMIVLHGEHLVPDWCWASIGPASARC